MRAYFRGAPALLALGVALLGCAPSSNPVAPPTDPAGAATLAPSVVLGVDDMV